MAEAIPPDQGRCLVCGRGLTDAAHYVVDMPDGMHVRCMRWDGERYPFEGVLRMVRIQYRSVGRVRRALWSLAVWLDEQRRWWPRHDGTIRAPLRHRIRSLRRVLGQEGQGGNSDSLEP